MTLTLTAARHRARAHLQFGWFRRSASSGYVFCPDCRAQVGAAWSAWATPGEIGHNLREALADHLRDECRRCPVHHAPRTAGTWTKACTCPSDAHGIEEAD